MHERPLTMEEYLASPAIVEPFRKEDCCLISDGGAAYVMTTPERARDLRPPVVEVAGVGLGNSRTGTHWAQQGAFTSTPQVFAAPPAFAMAGLTPDDVDVYTCYDPFTIVSLMQIEDMRLLRQGRRAFASGARRSTGRCRSTPTAGCCPTPTSSASPTSSRSCASCGARPPHQVAGAEVGVYGGYTGPQASTLILRKAR